MSGLPACSAVSSLSQSDTTFVGNQILSDKRFN